MKKLILTAVIIILITSCRNNNDCKADEGFEKFYFEMVDTIKAFGKQFDTDKDVSIISERWERFLKCTDYLGALMDYEFH